LPFFFHRDYHRESSQKLLKILNFRLQPPYLCLKPPRSPLKFRESKSFNFSTFWRLGIPGKITKTALLDLAEDFNVSRDVPYSPLAYGPIQAQYFFFPRPFSNIILTVNNWKRSSKIDSIPLRRTEIKLGKELVRKTSDKLLAGLAFGTLK
jgi:hypothetical protein